MPTSPLQSATNSFLTPKDVSSLLQVSVYTVRRWIKDGELPAYKVGRLWRIDETELNQWLDGQRMADLT